MDTYTPAFDCHNTSHLITPPPKKSKQRHAHTTKHPHTQKKEGGEIAKVWPHPFFKN
jgi:hypothetical protein